MGALEELEQQFLPLRLAQVERQAQLVARVGLPEQRATLDVPGAQGIALAGFLDLDHLGPEIGELQRQHVAGDKPRQVEHRDTVERTTGRWLQREHQDLPRWLPLPREAGWMPQQ